MLFTGLLPLATLLSGFATAHKAEHPKVPHVPDVSVNNTGPITLEAGLYEHFDSGLFDDHAEIKAYDNGLFVNIKKSVLTESYCPLSKRTRTVCKRLNSSLAWFEVETRKPHAPAALTLSVHVPGGQSLFVNQTSGAIGFLQAHSTYPLFGLPIVPQVSLPGDQSIGLTNEYLVNPSHKEINDFYFCATDDKHQFTVNAFEPMTGVVCKRGYIKYRFPAKGEKSGAWQYV